MLRVMNRRRARFGWLEAAGLGSAAAGLFFMFFWELADLTPGLSAAETASRQDSASLHSIIHNPVNAPHKLLEFMFQKLAPHDIFWLRLPSVIFALIFLVFFYKLAVGWFGRAIGLFGAAVFATLPLFVVSSRQASAEIMFFAPAALLCLYVWLLKTEKSKAAAWLCLLLAAALALYTPGMIWWIAGAFIAARKRIIAAIAGTPSYISTAGLLAMAAAVGTLAAAAARNHAVARQLLLVPDNFGSVIHILKNIGWMGLGLFWKTGASSGLIVGRLPLLDVLALVLLVFGIYAMAGAARAKAAAFGLWIIFSIIAAGLNNDLALLAIGLPAAGVFITAGLRYLYIEWRSIFPRNPVPKTFALVLIAAVTLSQLYFGLRYSLVAWPHSQTARSSYVLK